MVKNESSEVSQRRWIQNGIAFETLAAVEPEPGTFPPRRRLARALGAGR